MTMASTAQNFGEIQGKVIDELTGEVVPFAQVWVETGTVPIGTTSDIDGRYTIKPLEPGYYDLHVLDSRYAEFIKQGVNVRTNEITVLPTISMSIKTLGVVVITELAGEPLIYKDNPEKMTIASVDIKQRADAKNTRAMLVSLVPGIKASSDGQQLYFRGSRPENMITFIDGVKVTAGEVPNIPSAAIHNLTVYTGGIPAKYGDMTGGVVVIETKGYMDFYREAQRERNALMQ